MKDIKLLACLLLFVVTSVGSAKGYRSQQPHQSHEAAQSKKSGPVLPWETPPAANDSCQASCSIDADCGQGGFCDTGKCARQISYCLNDRWSVNARGETWNCNAYRCNTLKGQCFRESTANDNCTSGYVFDGKKSCIPSVSCPVTDPTCQDLYARWVNARHEYEKQTPSPVAAPFSCVACQTHDQCGSDQMCWSKRCEQADSFCAINGNNEAVVANKQGVVSSCQNFACDPIAKSCFTSCESAQDCRNGKTCTNGLCL